MQIPEAIKRLARIKHTLRGPYPTEDTDAIQLAIEVLAYYQRLRLAGSIDLSYLLPGETKE